MTGKENYATEYAYDSGSRLEREKTTHKDGNIDMRDYLYKSSTGEYYLYAKI